MANPYYTTLSNIFGNIRDKFQLDSTTLPDAILLPYAQKRYREMLANVYKLDRSYYADILNFSLVPDQSEYAKPVDSAPSSSGGGGLIKILRLEVSYSGKAQDYVPVEWMDEKAVTGLALWDEQNVNAQFSYTHPYAYELDTSFFLLPYPTNNPAYGNTLQGSTGSEQAYLFCVKRTAELTDSTSIPNIDLEFLGVLEDGVKVDVCEKLFGPGSVQSESAKKDYFGIKDEQTGVSTGMAAMIEAYANKDLAAEWYIGHDQTISYR